jgi:hypothetical protein
MLIFLMAYFFSSRKNAAIPTPRGNQEILPFSKGEKSVEGNQNVIFQTEVSFSAAESEAQAAFQYFLDALEQDAILTHEEQHDKIQEFKIFANNLSPKVASCLTSLLIEEIRSRIIEMLQNAALDSLEIDAYLAGYEEAILRV